MGLHSFYHSIQTITKPKENWNKIYCSLFSTVRLFYFYRFFKVSFLLLKFFFIIFFRAFKHWLFFSNKNFNGHFQRKKKLTWGEFCEKHTTWKEKRKNWFFSHFVYRIPHTAHFTWTKFSMKCNKISDFSLEINCDDDNTTNQEML